MLLGGIVGRQTLEPSAKWSVAGYYAAWRSLEGSDSAGSYLRQVPPLPDGARPAANYYLPSELGVHHYTVSGVAGLPILRYAASKRCMQCGNRAMLCGSRIYLCLCDP